MANTLYNKTRESFAKGLINWESSPVAAFLVPAGTYTYNIAHASLADLGAPAKVFKASMLGRVVTSVGGCQADATLFAGPNGPTISEVVIALDTGVDSTSILIAHIDVLGGLPFVSSNTPVFVSWNATSAGIFTL